MEQETLLSKVKAFALGWVAPIVGLLAWVYFLLQGKKEAEDKLAMSLANQKIEKTQVAAKEAEDAAKQATTQAQDAESDYARIRDDYQHEHGKGSGVPAGDPSVRQGSGGEEPSSNDGGPRSGAV